MTRSLLSMLRSSWIAALALVASSGCLAFEADNEDDEVRDPGVVIIEPGPPARPTGCVRPRPACADGTAADPPMPSAVPIVRDIVRLPPVDPWPAPTRPGLWRGFTALGASSSQVKIEIEGEIRLLDVALDASEMPVVESGTEVIVGEAHGSFVVEDTAGRVVVAWTAGWSHPTSYHDVAIGLAEGTGCMAFVPSGYGCGWTYWLPALRVTTPSSAAGQIVEQGTSVRVDSPTMGQLLLRHFSSRMQDLSPGCVECADPAHPPFFSAAIVRAAP